MTALRLDYLPDALVRITFDQLGSRANTMGQAVLAEFATLLNEIEAKPELHGLLLVSGKPGMFIAGADLKELGQVPASPEEVRRLVQRGLDLIARFERLPFPTIALVDGVCLGGGLELILGCDYRLAGTHPKVEFGAPEVKIGLIPGWGGTQRLTRLLGPSAALEMICTGEPIQAQRARELGLVFDVVPSERLQTEAMSLLQWSRSTGEWEGLRQRKQQPVGLSEDQFQFTFDAARAQVLQKTKGQLPAPLAAVAAIANGCNRPLADGLQAETDAFVPLVGSTISRNLIALFQTTRLQKDPGVADPSIQPRPVSQVGVIGAGIMGAGIAGVHLRRGVPTLLVDVTSEAIEKGRSAIVKVLQARVELGKMQPTEVIETLEKLTTTRDVGLVHDRDVVIEAVVENEGVKTKLYQSIEPLLGPNAILASNTSTISISRMSQGLARPGQFAGLHFFNPVDRMQLVEVIRGEQTSDQTVATLVAHARRIGKSPIVVKDGPGFLVNRILFPYLNEALALVEEGAAPRAIDQAATAFGLPMGPLALYDVVGLDTAWFAGRVLAEAFPERARISPLLGDLVQAGRLGQKSGAGFYSYAKGSRGVDDPELAPFVERPRSAQRTVAAEELTDRLFLPMLVEASLVLMEGIVREPAEVDMGLILGIGFPTFRGGLLRWADTVGLDKIEPVLAKYAPLGRRFVPTEQIRRLAASKTGFFSA